MRIPIGAEKFLSFLMRKDNICPRCYFCHNKMIVYVGTFLCPKCDKNIIYNLKYEHDVEKGRIKP